MAVSDQQIGENIARLRGNLSQKDLAATMREFGWRWSQATVWSIEKGERPLRLAEAADLATVLGAVAGNSQLTALDLLVLDGSPEVTAMIRRIQQSYYEARDAAEHFESDQVMLRLLAEQEDLSESQRKAVGEWLSESLTRERKRTVINLEAEEPDGEHQEAPER